MHPLSGSNLTTLSRTLWQNGGVSPRHLPMAAAILASVIGRLPFTTAERLLVARRLRQEGPMPAPVFIVGHWRSGTTHLYNVMSTGDFGYVSPFAAGMPWDLLGLVSACRPLLARFLPSHRWIDNIPVTPESPQEDEVGLANMTPLSFYHGFYFPRHFESTFMRSIFLDDVSQEEIREWERMFRTFLGKVWLDQGKKQLLIKNPVYTARLAQVAALYPDAKFIHIVRNPYEIFESMRNFHDKLLQQFALQSHSEIDFDSIIFRTYARMMNALIADAPKLPEGSFMEVRYENLRARPMDVLGDIYQHLGLSGFEEARPRFESYLASVKGYRSNRYAYPAEDLAKVEAHWGPFLERWGYGPPRQDRSA